MHKRSDEIVAISTPQGRGGIGIVRISGPQVLTLVTSFIHSKVDLLSLQSEKKRKLIYAHIVNNEQKIDEILLAYLPANRAYTGEPTVELNCHGGRAVLTAVLECAIEHGARLAEPGEFTRRAFNNGRIDLVQAEAINDLINARTKSAVKAAWRQIEGGLTSKCRRLKELLFLVYSELQAEIDFEIECNQEKWLSNLDQANELIMSMLKAAERSKYLHQGCWVVITGPPNAGKSSIFNDIVNIERSIVCDSPGTTRDHISETLDIDGIEVRLTDTAGIRETKDQIEAISIEKSKQQVESADIVVYVLDQNKMLGYEHKSEADNVLKNKGLVLFNKSDLEKHVSVDEYIKSRRDSNILEISILSNYGIDLFLDKLAELINNKAQNEENPVITNMRQTKLLESAKKCIDNSISSLRNRVMDICMYEVKESIASLSQIIGEISEEEVLDSVFSKFCVGK